MFLGPIEQSKPWNTNGISCLKGGQYHQFHDELAAETIEFMINQIDGFDKSTIDDVIVGNAMPTMLMWRFKKIADMQDCQFT